MFQQITIIAFAVVVGAVLLHSLLFRLRCGLGTLLRKIMHLLALLLLPQKWNWAGYLYALAFLVGLASFCVLLITGFLPVVLGGRLHGFMLMFHAICAPVFIACTAVVAVIGAARYTFNKKDAELLRCDQGSRRCRLTDSGIGVKAGFWALLVMSLPVTLTMVLCMLPLFGSHGQEVLLDAHRWCALIFALVAIVELYMLIRMEIIKVSK